MGNIGFSPVSLAIYLIALIATLLYTKEVNTSDVVFPSDKLSDELDPHRSERSLGILRKYIKGIVRIGEGLPEPGPGNSGLTIRIPAALGQIFKPDKRGDQTGEYEESNVRPPYRPQLPPDEIPSRPSYNRQPDVNNGGYRPTTSRLPYQPDNHGSGGGGGGGGYGSHGNMIYFTTESSYHTSDYHGGSAPYDPDRHGYSTTRRPNNHHGQSNNGKPPHNEVTTRKPDNNNGGSGNNGNSGLEEGPNCGVRSQQRSDFEERILGGRDTESNEFPWQVALKHPSQGVFCGGAVINRRWIITAAHCVVKLRDLNSVVGLVGSSHLKDSSVHEFHFIKLISHRSYRSDTYENDIALLQSDTDLPLYPSTPTINTICLPREKDTNYHGKGTISGWGRTSEGAFDTSESLLAAEVEIMDDSRCMKYYSDKFKQGKQICAGIDEGGRDSCQGDSGGPLIKKVENKFYLVGIVSYGRGCGRRGSPGVYTKVSHYVHWIRAQI